MGLQDDLLTLAIKIENGEASAAEIATVQKAVDSLGESSEKLGAGFAKPVEHAGLHLLTHELAAASGVAGQSRVAFMLANAAAAGLGETAMAVLGPLALAIGGAALAYELFAKNSEKAKKAAEEDLQAEKDLASQYRETLATLKEAGIATGAYHDLIEKGLGQASRNTAHDMGKAMAALQKEIAENQAKLQDWNEKVKESAGYVDILDRAMHDKAVRSADELSRKIADQIIKLGVMKENLPAVAKGHESIAAAAKEHADALEKLKEAEDKAQKAFEEGEKKRDAAWKEEEAQYKKRQQLAETYAQKIKDLDDIGAESTKSPYEKKEAEIKKFNDDQLHQIKELHDREIEAGLSVAEADAHANDLKTHLSNVVAQKEKENYTAIEQSGIAAAQRVADAFAAAQARIIMGHTNMRQQVLLIEKQMEQDAIESAIKIAEQWVASEIKKQFASKATQAASDAAGASAVAATHAQTTAVVALGTALDAATDSAIALDAALAAAE